MFFFVYFFLSDRWKTSFLQTHGLPLVWFGGSSANIKFLLSKEKDDTIDEPELPQDSIQVQGAACLQLWS